MDKSQVTNGEDQELNEFEQAKQEFRTRYTDNKIDLIKLARVMKAVEDTRDRLKGELKMANAEYDVLRLEIIPTRMEDKGLEHFKVEDLGRVGLSADLYVSVKSGQKDKFFAWLKKNRLGDLIQGAVNSSTLKAFAKRRIKEAKPIPKDLVNVTPYMKATITKV